MATDDRKPLSTRVIKKRFPARDAARVGGIAVEHSHFVNGGTEPPTVKTRVVEVEAPRGEGKQYEVIVEIDGVRVGGRAFPPGLKGTSVKRSRSRQTIDLDDALLQSFVPDHSCVRSASSRAGQGTAHFQCQARSKDRPADDGLRSRRSTRVSRHELPVGNGGVG